MVTTASRIHNCVVLILEKKKNHEKMHEINNIKLGDELNEKSNVFNKFCFSFTDIL